MALTQVSLLHDVLSGISQSRLALLRSSWLIDHLVYQVSIDQGSDNARSKVDTKTTSYHGVDHHTPYALLSRLDKGDIVPNLGTSARESNIGGWLVLAAEKNVISACLDRRHACFDF